MSGRPSQEVCELRLDDRDSPPRVLPQPLGPRTQLRPGIRHHPICARRIKGIHHRTRPSIVVTLIPRQRRLLRVDELPSSHPARCFIGAYMRPLDSVKMTADNVFRGC